jgi:hypothetical protein
VEHTSASSTFTAGLRVLLGLLGLGSFAAGVLAVFVTENGTGTGVLLGFGGILIVLALPGNHIDSFEFGGARLRLRASAAEKFALAVESERRGDAVEADRLRAQARALLDARRTRSRLTTGLCVTPCPPEPRAPTRWRR